MKGKLKVFFLTVVSSFLLVSCSGSKEESKETNSPKVVTVTDFKTSVENEGTAIKGGTLRVGVSASGPFTGIFNGSLYSAGRDMHFMRDLMYVDFSSEKNFKIGDKGPLTMELDKEEKSVIVKINKDYKWHNGTDVTAEDFIYNFYLVGHPDYQGIRYNDQYKNIVGMDEYHQGLSDVISGVKKIDDKTVSITYKEYYVSMQWGPCLPYYCIPYEQLKDIPIGELMQSDAIRVNPWSAGPFVMNNIVPGESVEYVANEYYWKGRPKIDRVIAEITPTSTITQAIKSGKFDIILDFPNDVYPEVKDLDNITLLGREAKYYAYLGFKLGTFDKANNVNVTDPNLKMANVNLRHAMGHAVNIDVVNNEFYHGLSPRANSLIIPLFDFHDKDLVGHNFDPEKAKKLLDEAGYIDIDKDGFREDPNGNKLVINFLFMSGGDIAEPLASYYIQSWGDIGIEVKLVDGRLTEFNKFYAMIREDSPKYDMFMGAWGVGSNPDPKSLYAKGSSLNYSRYTDEKLDNLINDLSSERVWDPEYQMKAFKDYQAYVDETAFIIPMRYRKELFPINKRVKFFDINPFPAFDWSTIELTAEEPIRG